MRIATLIEQAYVLSCNNFNTAITDGDFPASGSYIPVHDYERIAFLVRAGTLDSALTCKVQESTSTSATPSDVSGATFTVGATDDNDVFLLEIETRKLTKPYVTLDVAGAAGGNDYLDIMFIGFNVGAQPVTQPATTNTTLVAG